MTDRVVHLTVLLEHPIREDAVDDIVQALGMVKGVMHVVPHIDENSAGQYWGLQKARRDYTRDLLDLIEKWNGKDHHA